MFKSSQLANGDISRRQQSLISPAKMLRYTVNSQKLRTETRLMDNFYSDLVSVRIYAAESLFHRAQH